MTNPLRLFFAASTFSFCFGDASIALADSIYLKNGDKFSGKIISFNNGLCIFYTNFSSAVRIPIADIQSITSKDQYHILFANGEQAIGQLKSALDNRTLLESPTFGELLISASKITQLTKAFQARQNLDTSAPDQEPDDDTPNNSYGSETAAQPPLDFLTGSTVLLSPGEYEMDLGIAYKQNRLQYALPQAGYFQRSSYSAKQLEFRSTLRAGIYEGIEGYLSAPITYSHIQDVSSNEHVRHADAWNLADIAFGAQYQFIDESADRPAISLTFDLSAPTGRKRYSDTFNSWKDPLNNGSGHWSIAPGLAFVRTTDPAILFGGVSYQYYFPNTIDGYHVQPGWVLKSYAGVGFALNEKLSLGTRLSYAYSANLKADHEIIHGSDADPIDLSLSASYRVSNDWVISPGVIFGLNDDSGPAALSINFKRHFN
ncbi:transporter [Pseudomonas sp. FEN]|uniref:transporter n=1 Tax=Pseudomonas sp. FEN TaxID=2767468 RepID=UPI00174CE585|nr:transporter [Pseudomonas sp. FEN]